MRLWKFDSKIPNMFHVEDIYVYRKTFPEKKWTAEEKSPTLPPPPPPSLCLERSTPHIENGVPFCVLQP